MNAAATQVVITWSDLNGARVHHETIGELVHKCFPHEFSASTDDSVEEEEEDILTVLCGVHDEAQSLILFCRLPHRASPIGFALFFRYTDSLYVSTLCIDPAHRRRGHAALLMRSASALTASLGLKSLTGTVDASATHLLRFYARLGAVARPVPPAGDSAAVFTRRFDAPSGAATALGAPIPENDRDVRVEARWPTWYTSRHHLTSMLGIVAVAGLIVRVAPHYMCAPHFLRHLGSSSWNKRYYHPQTAH
jgi:GNAT superfamily N-acetyltransferase